MEKNNRKISLKLLLAEFGVVIMGTAGVWLCGLLHKAALDRQLANCVMTALGLAMAGFQLRREYLRGELDYNNNEHPFRFWLCVCIGWMIAFASSFLPAGGWPFLVVFVMLSLFSNMSTGILTASVLLMIPTLLGEASVGCFMLYFISGCFAVTLFRNLKSDFKIGIPLTLSALCLLVCETANVVLPVNARPDPEMFVIPAANIIISCILLVGCLKLFSSMVVYQFRENYLDLNDTENPILTEYKARFREDYFISIHTAYFCDRIGSQLGMNVDLLKCAGYYHKMGDRLPALMKEKKFPPRLQEVLTEFQEKYQTKKPLQLKETTVLYCANLVIEVISRMIKESGGEPVNYEAAVDGIFKQMMDEGRFWQSELTMKEYKVMYRTFREGKLYYDFLR